MKGAKTPGSGRKAGTPNKTTAEIRAMAQEHGPAAIEFFADVMSDPEQPLIARHLAAKELLDRGYGKASAVPPLADSETRVALSDLPSRAWRA